MTALDRVLPTPRLVEIDGIDVAVPPAEAWNIARHADFGKSSSLVRALFAVRTLVDPEELALTIDGLTSTREAPGFQILVDHEPSEVVVGAIGKVWQLDIPFVHVDGPAAFVRFEERGFVKVAWALRVLPRGEHDSRIELEVRVDATDALSWNKFRAYFAVIGIGSRWIRHTLLAGLARQLGTPEGEEGERPMHGDELLPDAGATMTDGITIDATPEAIWPWLVQMGCDRAGYYSVDILDNGGRRSAREIHAELQNVRVGDVLPAKPGSAEGFEVLEIVPHRALVLGGLWDAEKECQLPFASARPDRFWHVTWAFVLEPLDRATTRLHVRARASFPATGSMHATWIRFVHSLMETARLRNLKVRAEWKTPRDDLHDVLEGVGGAVRILFAMMTPFQRSARSHWGVDEWTAQRILPGDELLQNPRWSWTHGVEIDAPVAAVWPWIAQIGADKAGFYSYQWLENVAGCDLRNAETVHPEWELGPHASLSLHPHMPPLAVVAMERGRWFVAYAAPDEKAREAGRPWAAASWLFYLEPTITGGCRLVSRYRAACSDDIATRLSFGPTLVEPLGFAMDRRMLLGVRERVERAASQRPLRRLAVLAP